MKRAVVILVTAAGCARGTSFGTGGDAASSGGQDAPVVLDAPPRDIDAKVFEDAKGYEDAKVYDDAKVYEDARVYEDAKVYMDACVPVQTQLLANPTFDLSPQGSDWVQVPIKATSPIITNNSDETPNSAPYYAWLGGFAGSNGNSVTDQLYQDVAVPADTTKLVLSGVRVVNTFETDNTTPYDTATVELAKTDGTPIETALSLSNEDDDGTLSWTSFSHSFTKLGAGQTVRLLFTSTNDFSNPTNFMFDTLQLTATHCP